MDTNLDAMKEAMNDELFVADLREVMDDFRDADAEVLADELPEMNERDYGKRNP